MAQAVARAKYIRIAPRKVRLVADLIRGKKVADARDLLTVTIKGAAPVVGKVLAAAVANAESAAAESRERVDTDEMTVSEIMVDGGRTMKSFRPAARGRAARIRKRSSHIHLVISD
jgi:large subunit ribosomal protein L22